MKIYQKEIIFIHSSNILHLSSGNLKFKVLLSSVSVGVCVAVGDNTSVVDGLLLPFCSERRVFLVQVH